MIKNLALRVGGYNVNPPAGVPEGGISETFFSISVLLSWLVGVGVVAALFFLVWGGISYITSGGDKQKIHNARQKITFSILGLIVILGSYLIVGIIYKFFGISSGSGGCGGGRPGGPIPC